MSKESQTPRSRREARLQRGSGPGGNQNGGGTPAGAESATTPPSGTSEGPERSSQARARDREAHRAYRALTETIPVDPAAHAQPTRRQLRRQQLEREQGTQTAGTSRPPVVAPANRPGGPASPPAGESSAKNRAPQALQPDAEYRPNRPPIAGGRRERRRRSTGSDTAATAAEPLTTDEAALPDAAAEAVDAGKMTVEQALAAKELLMGQARNLAAMMEVRKDQDPRTVDLEILAQQKALAERAAVLNRRAADKQRLSQDNQQRRQTAGPGDVASAPMEFVRLPGSDKHVLRPSPTSNVPLVSNVPARAAETRTGVPVRPVAPATRPAAPASPAKSRLLAQAESVADGRGRNVEPLSARSAHGLDPLDARTAGQANSARIAVTAALVLGGAAFITGVVMMIIGLSN